MPPAPVLIVGLGNPGPKYANTRHNVGFRVVDALARRKRVSLSTEGDVQVGWTTHNGTRLGLAKPLTFMNRSGDAVAPLLEAHDMAPASLLVVVDDLHLDVGQLRLRPGGSSGGHNGLKHIAERLGTTNYPRLRVGIGSDYARGQQAAYVLAPFTRQQHAVIDDALIDACNAALAFATDGLNAAMNRYNG
jgi:PTH1 family peptidyl-tRNA hydrolase